MQNLGLSEDIELFISSSSFAASEEFNTIRDFPKTCRYNMSPEDYMISCINQSDARYPDCTEVFCPITVSKPFM